jgi:hypothetical protein
MLTLSQQDFLRLVQFVKKNYGIDLSKKMQLIMGRLSNTIISMGYTSFTDYIDHILSSKKSGGPGGNVKQANDKLHLFYEGRSPL